MHITELNRAVVLTSVSVASRVRPADLARPTPCAGWSVTDLLAHMSVQHHGFAAAARGEQARWEPRAAADPVADYLSASAEVLQAFAGADRPFSLPEIGPAPFPAEQAIGFHFIDYVVHSWDLARAVGTSVSFDNEVLEPALGIARFVPGGAARTRPGAAFAPALSERDGGLLDQILVLLGRSPDWPEPVR
ncbi:TIGR03086 family metal-binding protein [Amycolatopsis acidiphila]|uniref:TIGR03086 family protein n=1 Tax=Amycolatopsis acidiphila TaxID=715473 RepID=A0A558AFF6_9PSEU|nr:TIGR03086 family metal-binding protein [Amycolatopsis acidiphila]TVT22963.1 TIGR03086 family protein [Amycolatopsis acidiphila]UIJ57123.1 TIGR03086 family metal-binding protein [Amycolatopsis acidiphila]GHG53233.1 TIGR03086 family protein [Amycolatopsis acidiphila]